MANTPTLFAVRDLPLDVFGSQHGRQTRKFVLMLIASYADWNGANCYPSIVTVAMRCGLTKRGTQKVVAWLIEHGLLEVVPQAGPRRTNLFRVLPGETNISVQSERQYSGCLEIGQTVNGGAESVNGEAVEDEHQRSHYLPKPSTIPKRAPTKAEPFALPDWIPSESWNGWVEMRRRIRAPLTNRAKELAIQELVRLQEQGEDPGEVLDRSTRNSWRGLFPTTQGGNGSGHKSQKCVTFAEQRTANNRAAADEAKLRLRALRQAHLQ